MEKKILVIDCAVENKELSCFEDLQNLYGFSLNYIAPAIDGVEELSKYDNPAGIIIFGSFTNVEDNLSWHKTLVDYVLPKIKNNTPTLGICFGHQLITHAFGGKVGLSSTEREGGHKGFRDVQFLTRFFSIKKSERIPLLVSHKHEVKELPEDFVHLAQSPECKYDAVAHESLPFIGFQAHPEANKDFVEHTMNYPLSDSDYMTAKKYGDKVMLNFLELVKQHLEE